MAGLGRNTRMPDQLANVKRPHPITYLVILFFGYLAGMKSGGSWGDFFIIAFGYFVTYVIIRILKYGWNAV
jgi:hypothetical protein